LETRDTWTGKNLDFLQGVNNMQFGRINIFICLLLILFIPGCGLQKAPQPEPEPVQEHQQQTVTKTEPEPSQAVSTKMVEEYARIHQISDLKTAEYYLTHPDYAKENPYTPTEEDIVFFERDFLERMYPDFKKMAEKEGFMKARNIYMNNPPAGPGSRFIGSRRYGAMMQKIAASGGEGASTGEADILLEIDPAAVYYKEAMGLYRAGRLDEAIERMEKAIQAKPDSPSLLYGLGVMYMEKAEHPRAVQLMQSAVDHIKSTGLTGVNLAMYPDVYMGALTNLGLMYTRVGMYEKAVEVLKEALQFRPRDLDANYNLVNTYYVMGEMEKTSTQLRKFISLDPKNAEAHNIAGLIYYRRGFHNAALDEFQAAQKLNPAEKQYSHNLGTVLAELGRNEEANEAFRRASGLDTGSDMRETYAEQTEENRILKQYNDGYAAMESQNWDQAIEHFEAVLKSRPDMMEAHVNLGVCYRMKGDTEKQIHHFGEAARLEPDMPDIRHNLGLAYSDARMYPQAIGEFNKAVELDPSLKYSHFSLGMALFRISDYAKAAAQFEKCLELSPNWVEAILNLGTCYMKTGRENDAMKLFEKAAQLKPNSAETQHNLGVVYMNMGNYDKASALFQKALEIDPAHKQARMMLKELEIYQGEK
jgi:tetratricopeptide (TPR) repeat protein